MILPGGRAELDPARRTARRVPLAGSPVGGAPVVGWLPMGVPATVLDVDDWEAPRWVLLATGDGDVGWALAALIRNIPEKSSTV